MAKSDSLKGGKSQTWQPAHPPDLLSSSLKEDQPPASLWGDRMICSFNWILQELTALKMLVYIFSHIYTYCTSFNIQHKVYNLFDRLKK